jgi:type IV secretory pathway VirB2 component (pilin)
MTTKSFIEKTQLKFSLKFPSSLVSRLSEALILFFLASFHSAAFANNPMVKGTTWVQGVLLDVAAPAFSIVIIACGIAWWLQKLTIAMALKIAGGSALVFGAAYFAAGMISAVS